MKKQQKKTLRAIGIIGLIIELILTIILVVLNLTQTINVSLVQWVWFGILIYIFGVIIYFTAEKKKNDEDD